MDETAHATRSPSLNLVIFLATLLILSQVLFWILESLVGLSGGTNSSIIMFVVYAACYPVRTKIQWGDQGLKKKTLLQWLVDAFLWASACFTLYTLLGYVFPHSN